MIVVRRIGEDAWREWRAMRLAALASDPAAFRSTLAEWSGTNDLESRWRARLAGSPFSALVDLDGRAAGMVAAYRPQGELELVSLWVHPSFRGRGVGEAAISAVVELAEAADVLLSVRAGNGPAIRLYERCGFVDDGVSPDDPGERRMRRRGRPAGGTSDARSATA